MLNIVQLKSFILFKFYVILCVILSSEFSAQGQVLHCKCRNQGCSSAEGRSSTVNSATKLQFYQGWIGAVASRCFLHPTFSLISEQIWKDPRSTNLEVRRVYLVNWALRTSPKFTTWVKYEFHQSFWPDQRSGNPNHPSPCLHYRPIAILLVAQNFTKNYQKNKL